MSNTDETAETAGRREVKRPVLTRFTDEELAQMRELTGACADATAVACFVRNNLRKVSA